VARDLKPGYIREADVVDLAHDGRGVARDAGKAVFIDGALPGERVRYRVFKRRRQLDEAGLVEILSPSPDRVVPRCAHFGICGGCSLQHLSATAQLEAKQRQLLDNLQRIGRVIPDRVLAPLRGPAWAYRRRARLGVKYVHKKGRVLAGFREREKPYIADIRRCEILPEPLGTLPTSLAALVETLDIREKLPQVEVSGGDAQTALVFRVLEPPGAADIEKIAAFGTTQRVDLSAARRPRHGSPVAAGLSSLELRRGRGSRGHRVRTRGLHPGKPRGQRLHGDRSHGIAASHGR